jgi:RecJ-like exonuclease
MYSLIKQGRLMMANDPNATRPGDQAKPGTPGTGENVCPDCKGTGKVGERACETCKGTGVVIEGVGGG